MLYGNILHKVKVYICISNPKSVIFQSREFNNL